MELHQILIVHIPSKEVKVRINNRQIKVNNEVVLSSKIDVNAIETQGAELGNFIYKHLDKIPNCFKYIDIKNFFGEGGTNVKGVSFLNEYTLITLSKREHIVLKAVL